MQDFSRGGVTAPGGVNLLFGQPNFTQKKSMKMDNEPLNPAPLIPIANSWGGFKGIR